MLNMKYIIDGKLHRHRVESSIKWFFQNYLPKFEHFDWLISKLISLLPNQNACEISLLRNQLTDDSALGEVFTDFLVEL